LQRQFTLLPWCCRKKPHFLFAEPWKSVVFFNPGTQFPGNEKNYAMQYKKVPNQAGMNHIVIIILLLLYYLLILLFYLVFFFENAEYVVNLA